MRNRRVLGGGASKIDGDDVLFPIWLDSTTTTSREWLRLILAHRYMIHAVEADDIEHKILLDVHIGHPIAVAIGS